MAEVQEVARTTVRYYLTPVPTPWKKIAISALVAVLGGTLAYGASKKGWVGLVAGGASGALAYILQP
jgi:hypothetical protein